MAEDTNEFLDALGRRDLDLDLSPSEVADLRRAMKKLASTARLAHVAADRPANTSMDESIAQELLSAAESPAFQVFERSRASDILDRNGPLVFREVSAISVPQEDAEFLAECGIKDPKAEITISLTRLKAGFWPVNEEGQSRIGTAQILEFSRTEIVRVSRELSRQADEAPPAVAEQGAEPKKRKKILNGVGRILSGVVAGTGNVLMGVGAIPASGGTAAAAVIASAAVSVGVIMQGIGDLRGE